MQRKYLSKELRFRQLLNSTGSTARVIVPPQFIQEQMTFTFSTFQNVLLVLARAFLVLFHEEFTPLLVHLETRLTVWRFESPDCTLATRLRSKVLNPYEQSQA